MENYNWDDIETLPLNKEGLKVSAIIYSDEYKLVLGRLRALQTRKEYSERALYLTSEAIALNAAHYTVWNYRYYNVVELKKDIDEELNWVEEIALDNPKNYQIWHYRQLLLIYADKKDPRREFPLLQIMLDDDTKNYHVWAYRKWLVQWSEVWNHELEFVEKFIDRDVYNNSAWAHRFFAVYGPIGIIDEEIFQKEVQYAKEKIAIAPHNQSSWNYLTGLYEKQGKPFDDLESLCLQYANVLESNENLQSLPALELLAKIYKTKRPELAKKSYDLLGTVYDPMRINYWNYQKSLIV